MSHDRAYVQLALAAMQAAMTPNGGAFTSKAGVVYDLREAVRGIGPYRPSWLPEHLTMLDTARAVLANGEPMAMAVVHASLHAPWPTAVTAMPWQARRDIGGDDFDQVAT